MCICLLENSEAKAHPLDVYCVMYNVACGRECACAPTRHKYSTCTVHDTYMINLDLMCMGHGAPAGVYVRVHGVLGQLLSWAAVLAFKNGGQR